MTAAVAAGAQRCSGSLDPALYDRRPVLSAAERAALVSRKFSRLLP